MVVWIARLTLVLAMSLCLAASQDRPNRPQVAGPCTAIAVWSNGAHTSLIVPAAMLALDHPLRRPFAQAQWLLIGWGDAEFYPSDGTDIGLAARSLIPPRASVVHVLASNELPTEIFPASEVVWAGLNAAGAAGLSGYLAAAVAVDRDGAARLAAAGQVPGKSFFFQGVQGFHALRLCNHWTAMALRAGGLAVSPWGAFTAASVTGQTARAAVCAA